MSYLCFPEEETEASERNKFHKLVDDRSDLKPACLYLSCKTCMVVLEGRSSAPSFNPNQVEIHNFTCESEVGIIINYI